MKIKWIDIVREGHGRLGDEHYVRRSPGNSEYAISCHKPVISEATKRARAEHPTAIGFAALMAETKAILHDPERKAAWQSRYEEAKRQASKDGKPISGRLCDYIKKELSKEQKR